MCGIVAVINKNKYGFNANQLDIFENLLYIDAVRGDDSTGTFLVTNSGNVHIAKEAQDSNHFLKQTEWKNLRATAFNSGWALVGHNRKATRGSITDENAHPFWVEDKLVLVHNGSLLGDHKQLADTAVDSHAIAHVLANEPDAEKALSRINGAYALIWYDVEGKELKIIRNNERPLFWAETKDAFYIASEEGMLYMALWRANEKIINKDAWANSFREYELTTMHCETREIKTTPLDCKFRIGIGAPKTDVWDMREWQARMDAQLDCGDSCALPADRAVGGHQRLGRSKLMSLAEWSKLKEYRYIRGRKIKVVVDDFEWDINDPKGRAILKGKTTDGDMHAVEFEVPISEVQALTSRGDDEPVYEIQVGSVTWHATDAVLNTNGDKMGAVVVHGFNPINLMTVH